MTVNPDFDIFFTFPIKSVRDGRQSVKFHAKLDSGLKAAGVSVKQLAERLGVANNTIYTWIKGGPLPAIDQAAIIAEALNVPLIYLADDEMETVPGPPRLSENREKIEKLIEVLGEEESLTRLKGVPGAGVPLNSGVVNPSPSGRSPRRKNHDRISEN